MGSIGAARSGGGSSVTNTSTEQTVNQEAYNAAVSAVNAISSGKRFQEFTVDHPTTGDKIRVSVEKVTSRDYWGRSSGRATYTVYMWNESQKNEYGNSERMYYNYGVEKLSDVKNSIRDRLKIGRR